MTDLKCRSLVRLARLVILAAGVAVPAAAQPPITIVSPHAGEQVGRIAPYIVRWTASAIPGSARFAVYYRVDGEVRSVCEVAVSARTEFACEWLEPDEFARTLIVEARNASGTPIVAVESAPFDVVPENLPLPWTHQDIGNVGRSGGARGTDDGRIVVRGAGSDSWGTADAFHYAFAEIVSDNVDARVTIAGLEGTEPWTKVGVMLRHFLLPDSPHHFVFASRSKGVAYQRRLARGAETLHTSLSASSSLPVTVEVMRRSGYVVLNIRQGGVWHEVAAFAEEEWLLFGLAVTSHDRSRLATGTFGVALEQRPSDSEREKVQFLSPEFGVDDPLNPIVEGQPYTIQWTHAQPVNVATVSYSLDNGQTWAVVPGCASIAAMSCVWNSPGPATEAARIRVVIADPNDRSAWTVTYPMPIRPGPPTTLPPGWMSGDVGAVAAHGSASYTAGQFTVEGSGADIWSTADEFHFVSRTIVDEGDRDFGLEITARVISVENVNRWTKAGLMVRAHRGPGAAHISAFVTPSTEKGVAFQRRRADGSESVHTAGPAITAPVWLRFIIGNGEVRAYYRKSATDLWTFLGQDRVALGVPYEAGLAVSSHVDGRLARATFDNVTIFRRDSLPGHADIGATGVIGGTGMNDTERRLFGSGADIWGTADAFRYHYGTMGSAGSISAGVRSITNTHAWAKAGVMIRENVSPGSRHVMLIVSPGKGIAMQYRASPNGQSANVAIVPGAAPAWVRLTRSGPAVVGDVSIDGVTWREVGRVSLPMSSSATAGLGVTSHNNSRLATGVFEDVLLIP